VGAIAPGLRSGSIRIRTQTLLLSVVPVVFLLILLAFALLIQQATVTSAEFSARTSRALTQSARVQALLTEANRSATQYVVSHDPADLNRYRAAARIMPAELQALVTVANTPAQRVLAMQFASSVSRGMDLLADYLRFERTGQLARMRAIDTASSTQALSRQIDGDANAFDTAERQLVIDHTNAVRRTVWWYEIALIVTSIVGILTCLYMTVRFGFSIVRRLRLLAQSAQALGSGEASEPIKGNDEIAELDRVYHAMTRRIQREHAVASVLQSTLLPHELPSVPGLRIETAYIPAAQESEVGGDWYDVFTIGPECVGIGIGDVAGHGLDAASFMGTVRQAMRMAAYIDRDPGSVFENVNRLVCAASEKTVVTAFFATIDTQTGELKYAVAGHPMPLVMRPSGDVEALPGSGLMLGVDAAVHYQTFQTKLEPGCGMLLFTDGIVEHGRDYLAGMERLVDAFRTTSPTTQNVAEAVHQRVLRGSKLSDDAAVMYIGVTELGKAPAPVRYQWRFDARDERSSRRIKRALLWHLRSDRRDPEKISAAEVVAGELISNVARHTPGQIELTLEMQNGTATLQVYDHGAPFELTEKPPDLFADSGRGLIIVRALARNVTVQRSNGGNCVRAVLQ